MRKRSRPEFKTKFEFTLGSVASPNKGADEESEAQLCNDFFLLTPDFDALKAFFLKDKGNEAELKSKAGTLLEKCLKYTSCKPESDVDCIRSKNALEIAFFVSNVVQPSTEKTSVLLKECAKILTLSSQFENESSHFESESVPAESSLPVDNKYLMELKHAAVTKFIATVPTLKSKEASTTEGADSSQKESDAVLKGINIIEPAFDFAAQCLKSNPSPCKDVVLLLAVLISSFSSASYVCAMITRRDVLATMLDVLTLCMYNALHPPDAAAAQGAGGSSGSKGSFSFWGLLGFSSEKKDEGKIPDKHICSVAIPTLFVLREFIRLNQHFKEYAASTMMRMGVSNSGNSNNNNNGTEEYDEKKDFPRNLLETLFYAADNFENKPDSHVVLTYSLALDALLCLSLDPPKELDAVVTVKHNEATMQGPAVVLGLNSVSNIFSKPISYSLIEIQSKTLTFCQYAINTFFSSSLLADNSDYLFISDVHSNSNNAGHLRHHHHEHDLHSSNDGDIDSTVGVRNVVVTAEWDALWKGLFHIIHFIVVVAKSPSLTREQREKLSFVGKQALEILGVSLVQANRMASRKPAAVEGLWYEFMRTRAETTQLLSMCCEGSEGWWSTGTLITAIMGVLSGVIDRYQSTTITMDMVPSIIQEARKQIYSDDKIVSLLQPLEPKNPVNDPRDGQQERSLVTSIILNNEFSLLFSEQNK